MLSLEICGCHNSRPCAALDRISRRCCGRWVVMTCSGVTSGRFQVVQPRLKVTRVRAVMIRNKEERPCRPHTVLLVAVIRARECPTIAGRV